MPFFIVLCLALAVVVQTGNAAIQAILLSPFVLYGSLTVACLTIIATFFNKIPENISYDLFASSILFTWFAYWKPLFVKESPIFFYFPVYFAVIVAFTSLFFIGQRHRIDKDSLTRMQGIVDSGVIQPWFMMLCVLITLYFENRFIQYPTWMTLLTMRYALSGCLKPK